MNRDLASDLANRLRDISNRSNMPWCVNHSAGLREQILAVANDAKDEEPLVSDMLLRLKDRLFTVDNLGQGWINPYILGELVFGLDYLAAARADASCMDEWSYIHPRIQKASKQLYLDGHYKNASEDAFIELNARVKEIYKERSGAEKIPDGYKLMNDAFSGKDPVLMLRDISTQSGHDFQLGFQQMCAGSMLGFRNPKAHSNEEDLTAEEAMRRLMFASSLMFELDEACCGGGE